jgi:hypothetical protein
MPKSSDWVGVLLGFTPLGKTRKLAEAPPPAKPQRPPPPPSPPIAVSVGKVKRRRAGRHVDHLLPMSGRFAHLDRGYDDLGEWRAKYRADREARAKARAQIRTDASWGEALHDLAPPHAGEKSIACRAPSTADNRLDQRLREFLPRDQ